PMAYARPCKVGLDWQDARGHLEHVRRVRPVGRAHETQRRTLRPARRWWPTRQAVRAVYLHAHEVRRLARLVSLSGLRPALPCPLRHQQPALPKVSWSQVSIAVRNASLPPVGTGP